MISIPLTTPALFEFTSDGTAQGKTTASLCVRSYLDAHDVANTLR